MKILNLATSDEHGAGIVTRYTNNIFIESGHTALLVVKNSGLKNENVVVLRKPPAKNFFNYYAGKIRNRVKRIAKGFNHVAVDPKYSFHNLKESEKHHPDADKILKHVPFKPDVIVLFWISDFLNSKTIRDLHEKTNARIFWMMTDNAPITGGCHYPWACMGYQADCSNCPAILTPSKKDIARSNLAYKFQNLPDCVELVTSSEPDFQRALQSSLFKGKKVHKLFAPIDEAKFHPGDKSAARAHWGIESQKRVLFYAAHDNTDYRKGGQFFRDALAILREQFKKENINTGDFLILVAGSGGDDIFRDFDIPFRHLGYLNEEQLIKAYQAADFFVSSSLEDSGPLMINQSIMCGVPIVSFNVGVAVDMVLPGRTGYIAQVYDAADMAKGIRKLFLAGKDELQAMSVNSRELAINHFSKKIYTERTTKLFEGKS